MTPEWIEGQVRDIEAIAGDDEMAHGAEDQLHQEVLAAIANGETSDPAACARAALKTQNIKFARWCA